MYWIEYEHYVFGQWHAAEECCPISAPNRDAAVYKFSGVWIHTFGDTSPYRIVAVHDSRPTPQEQKGT